MLPSTFFQCIALQGASSQIALLTSAGRLYNAWRLASSHYCIWLCMVILRVGRGSCWLTTVQGLLTSAVYADFAALCLSRSQPRCHATGQPKWSSCNNSQRDIHTSAPGTSRCLGVGVPGEPLLYQLRCPPSHLSRDMATGHGKCCRY